MNQPLTLIAPTCACCAEPAPLLPRDDLPGALVVCPASGRLYRPGDQGYVPAELPTLAPARPAVPSVRIDLSRSGYA